MRSVVFGTRTDLRMGQASGVARDTQGVGRDARFSQQPSAFIRSLCKWFIQLRGCRALDVGCGRGRNARCLQMFGINVVCADSNAEVLAAIRDPRYALWMPEG